MKKREMAVYYRMYQNKRKGEQYGYWYARATQPQSVGLDAIAESIQRNCTVKRSDVKAVLTELVEVMTEELQAGNRVKLDGFGSFKIGIRCRGEKQLKDFSVANNVRSVHVLFQPETHVGADKTRVRTFLSGLVVKELPDYTAPAEPSEDSGAGGDTPSGGGDDGDDTP